MADDAEGLIPAKRLVEMAEDRRGKQMARVTAYEHYLAAYFEERKGDYPNSELTNYSDGRPALRAPGETALTRYRRAAPNYIKPIVRDLTAIRGSMPSVQVPPASGEQVDKDKATLIARALRQQQEQSMMVRQVARTGWFVTLLGDACMCLDPRTPQMARADPDPFKPAGVYYVSVNPHDAFPKFTMSGDDLQDLFWMIAVTRQDAHEQYPGVRVNPGDDDDLVTVIHYYSRNQRQTVVDGVRAFGIRHDLGFCPAEWISSEVTDGRYAQSDVSGCIELHAELQDLWKVYADTIVQAAYPIYWIHDPEQGQGQLELGPGAQYTTHGTGKLTLLAPQANPQSAQLIFETAADNLLKQAGIAPIRVEGQVDRSNISARSVDRQQAPMEQRLTLSLDLIGLSFQRLNSKCLLMLSNVADLKDAEMELYGQDKDGSYHQTFTGEDIGGWVRNRVTWEQMTGQSQQEKLLGRLQLYKEGQGDFPFDEVIQAAGYDDPQEIIQRGRSEMAARAAQQQAMGGAPPGAAPEGGPRSHHAGGGMGGAPDQAMRDQMSLERGGAGGPASAGPVQPPPGAPAGQPPGGGMPGFPPIASPPGAGPTPAPVPQVADDIKQAIQALPMRGGFKVIAHDGRWYVELEDHRDASQVITAIKPIGAKMGVDVKVAVVGPAAA